MKRQLTFYKELDYTPEIGDMIKSEAEQTIALHIKNVPDSLNLEEFYSGLSKKVGYFPFMDQDPVTAELSLNTWMEIKYVQEKQTLAYKYSNWSHPLHTDYCDMPLDFIDLEWSCLFCVQPAKVGGATVAVDPTLLLDVLGTYRAELYNELISTEVIFERPEATFGANTSKIIDFDEVGPLFCWNYVRVSPRNSPEVLDMCKRFNEFLETKVIGGGLMVPVYLRHGEALFFQDKRYLHGRNSFLGDRFLKKNPIVRYAVEKAKEVRGQMVAAG